MAGGDLQHHKAGRATAGVYPAGKPLHMLTGLKLEKLRAAIAATETESSAP